MIFGDILIENFLAIGSARVTLGKRGLVNVEGINNDDSSALSNGAGKSSFADAVSWCIFGKTARGDEGDAVVSWKAGKGTKVDLELLEGGDLWKIIRHRKHKEGKNAVHVWHYGPDAKATNLTKGTDKLTQEVINEIIGCSYEVFTGAVYAGQERMPDLPGMTDKQLKVLIEEASGSTILEKAYRVALTDLNTAKGKLDTASREVSLCLDRRYDAEEAIAGTKDSHRHWEEDRKRRVESMTAAIRSHAENARDIATKIASFNKADLEASLKTAETAIAGVESEKAELARLEAALSTASRTTAGLHTSAMRLKEDAEREKAGIDGLAHKIGCPCHTCDRPFSAEDIEPAKKLASTKLREIVASFKSEKAKLDAALIEQKRATEARDAFLATMTDVSANVALCASLRASLNQVAEYERMRDLAIRQAKEVKTRIDEIRAEVNPFIAAMEKCRTKFEEADKRYLAAGDDHKAAEDKLAVAESVAKVFSPAGVRAHILDTVTPFLNDRTARYLGALSDGNLNATWTTLVKTAKGELKEKFAIEVAHVAGGDRFTSISGGQKRKVRIACALALQDLVASRAAKAIELFIGDEIDDALDSAGIERLTMILEEKARERGSVFIISHNNLKDWVRNTITVTMTDQVATIEELAA